MVDQYEPLKKAWLDVMKKTEAKLNAYADTIGYGHRRVDDAIYRCHLDLAEDWTSEEIAELVHAILDQFGFSIDESRHVRDYVLSRWAKKGQ